MQIKYFLIRITCVTLIVLITQATFGQANFKQGSVITLTGDTLHGFIDYRNWGLSPDKISFKENLNDAIVSYIPLDIKGFNVLDERYESAIIETEISPTHNQNLELSAELKLKIDTAFLQAVVIGEKSLYYYFNNYGNTQYYIKNGSSFELLAYKKYIKIIKIMDPQKSAYLTTVTKVVESKKYLGQLSVYLNDCPNIMAKIESAKYEKERLEDIFHFYYSCTQSKASFQKKKEKIKTEFGVVAGYATTSISFVGSSPAYLVNAEFQQSKNFSAGLNLNLIIPRTNGKWSMYNELALSSYKVDGYYLSYTSANNFTVSNTTIGYSYLKMNNMARFCYPIGHFSVFVNAGISNGYGFNETNILHKEIKFYATERIEESKALNETRKFENGYILGGGIKYKRFSIEYRYEVGNGMSKYEFLDAKTKKSFILLGYKF